MERHGKTFDSSTYVERCFNVLCQQENVSINVVLGASFLERIFQSAQDEKLSEEVRSRLRIGVHWDTDPRLISVKWWKR